MEKLQARKTTVLAIDAPAAAAEPRRRWTRFFHGRHQRLPRGGRGGELRPLLQRPDHRRGQIPPAKVFIVSAPASPAWRRSAPAANLGAIVRANDTAPRSPTRWCRWRRVRQVDYDEEGWRRLRQGDERGLPEGRAAPRCTRQQAKDADIIITTALILGKPAPELITAEMVRA